MPGDVPIEAIPTGAMDAVRYNQDENEFRVYSEDFGLIGEHVLAVSAVLAEYPVLQS